MSSAPHNFIQPLRPAGITVSKRGAVRGKLFDKMLLNWHVLVEKLKLKPVSASSYKIPEIEPIAAAEPRRLPPMRLMTSRVLLLSAREGMFETASMRGSRLEACGIPSHGSVAVELFGSHPGSGLPYSAALASAPSCVSRRGELVILMDAEPIR